MTKAAQYQVLDADTREPIRTSCWSSPRRALSAGYIYCDKFPDRDFVVIDDRKRVMSRNWIGIWWNK